MCFFVCQRLFAIPATPSQKLIPFARVNHNKYMVTDKIAYIGKAAHHACGPPFTHDTCLQGKGNLTDLY